MRSCLCLLMSLLVCVACGAKSISPTLLPSCFHITFIASGSVLTFQALLLDIFEGSYGGDLSVY